MIDISAAELDRSFGRETVRRGRDYLERGHVLENEVTAGGGGVQVVGVVEGTRPTPYDVTVRVESMARGVEIWSVCTCPVRLSCKHGAAVLLAAQQDAGAGGTPRWAHRLDEMLTALERRSSPGTSAPTPLALQVEVKVSGHPRALLRTIRFRPVQRGRLGAWVRSGVEWHAVPGLRYRGEHDPHHVELLAEMATLLGPLYGTTPEVTRLGPALWPMLDRMRAAGMDLVPGPGVSEVRVLDRPVSVAADLRTEGEGLVLDFAVGETEQAAVSPAAGVPPGEVVRAPERAGEAAMQVAGPPDPSGHEPQHEPQHQPQHEPPHEPPQKWSLPEVELIGQPAHGVALLRPAPTPRGRSTSHFSVAFAPLARVLPDAVQALLRRGESLQVPEADRSRFVESYLPRLRRQLPTTSSDASVPLPEEKPPRLVLELEWLGAGRASGDFSWAYELGGTERRFALDSGAGTADVRRLDTEAAHLAALALDGPARELLCDSAGRLRAQHHWIGHDLLRLVDDVLPALQEHPRIELEESGERPDYRPAVGDPEIRFDLAGSADAEDGEDRRTDWLDLEVMIRVDGEQVPLATVLTALTRGQRVIFLPSGLHLRADHPAFDRLAELVAAAGELVEQPAERLRVARHDLGAWAELDELGVVDEQAAAWVSAAQALRGLDRLPEVPGTGLASELRSYQYDGLRWLAFLWQAGLGGVLADDMGLGKTLQALAVIGHAREHGAAPFLVVAPTSVVSAWAEEAARHTPKLAVRVVSATAARRGESIAELADGADVVVTSYTLLRLEDAAYAEVAWGGLVLDEAQQIKNHQSRAYRAVRSLDAPFRLALTGTPFENRLMELWSLLSVVAPGLYPSPQQFREVVVRPVERGEQQALDRFRRRIRPFLLRRTKQLVAVDMPPKQEQILQVPLGSRHRRIYDTHLQRERQTVLGLVGDFDRHRIAIFRSLTRLRQLSLDAALLDPDHEKIASAKTELLVEHLRELAEEGHRALVFSQFTSYLARVRRRLEAEGIATCYLDGRTRNRDRVIGHFREGDAPAFLISLKAGGVGLTLTEADYVFVLDPWWNPAVEAQAVDRTHRIGQQRPVMVYRLVATDTIEEKVMALKERKAALFRQVIDGGGAADGVIVAEDVRALFED